jgi:CBS domain-containing protein
MDDDVAATGISVNSKCHNQIMKIERSLRVVEVLSLELQPPLVLDAGLGAGEVIRAMRDSGLGYALITVDGQLAGIFTERDIFLSVLGNERVLQQPVSSLMSPEPVCVAGSDPVWRAVMLMHEGGYRQIPVVDGEGKIAGCVRQKDVAGYLVDHFAGYVLNLPPDPDQLAQTPDGG